MRAYQLIFVVITDNCSISEAYDTNLHFLCLLLPRTVGWQCFCLTLLGSASLSWAQVGSGSADVAQLHLPSHLKTQAHRSLLLRDIRHAVLMTEGRGRAEPSVPEHTKCFCSEESVIPLAKASQMAKSKISGVRGHNLL